MEGGGALEMDGSADASYVHFLLRRLETKPNVELGHLLLLKMELAKTMAWLPTLPRRSDVFSEFPSDVVEVPPSVPHPMN
ncbi:hypothetical protein V6N13_097575 [Hibiscus sabdariffa]|uniref:Uncharacterized protein n=2 Tax=Hibiscus sabdariffa TaxID=183260 RepID=A0ABR2AMW4_9ROSI